MRKIIKEFNVYKFEELSLEVQQKALKKNYDINLDYDWWDHFFEDAKEIGLEITSFGGGREISGLLNVSAEECALAILKNHGKPPEQKEETGTRKVSIDFLEDLSELRDNEEENEEEVEKISKEFENNLLDAYLDMLYDEFDYLASREAIIKAFEANNYEFTESGEIF